MSDIGCVNSAVIVAARSERIRPIGGANSRWMIALAFGGLQIRDARIAAQLQLYMQMHNQINAAAVNLATYQDELNEYLETKDKLLSSEIKKSIDYSTNHFEYMSWVFNHNYVTLPEARELWLKPMVMFFKYSMQVAYKKSIKKGSSKQEAINKHRAVYPQLYIFMESHLGEKLDEFIRNL